MAQSTDQSINSGLSGLAVRNAINENLAALFSSSSGASAPSPVVGGMPWLDTSPATPVLKLRNNANTAWLDVVTSDYATATGLALIQTASATAARSTLAAPPAPTNDPLIPGTWIHRSSSIGGALTLPAGGSWAWYVQSFNSGVLTAWFGAISAGGSTIASASAGILHIALVWRIE